MRENLDARRSGSDSGNAGVFHSVVLTANAIRICDTTQLRNLFASIAEHARKSLQRLSMHSATDQVNAAADADKETHT
jgi:hypothetical protein